MSAHTPGPWVAFDNGNNTHNIISYGGGRTGLVAVTFHLPVAPKDGEEATEQANAKLLAAAPDLLAALRRAHASMVLGMVAEVGSPIEKEARAAIAKAGGAA